MVGDSFLKLHLEFKEKVGVRVILPYTACRGENEHAAFSARRTQGEPGHQPV